MRHCRRWASVPGIIGWYFPLNLRKVFLSNKDQTQKEYTCWKYKILLCYWIMQNIFKISEYVLIAENFAKCWHLWEYNELLQNVKYFATNEKNLTVLVVMQIWRNLSFMHLSYHHADILEKCTRKKGGKHGGNCTLDTHHWPFLTRFFWEGGMVFPRTPN